MLLKHTLFNTGLGKRAAARIRSVSTILDIGAGVRPFHLFPCEHICVEPHFEYADILEKNGYPVIRKTALEALSEVEPVDSVFLLDVIEHMEKDEGLKVISLAKQKAREQVIIFTPLGFMPQHSEEVDPWGYQGMDWQEHRSGWMPDEFPGWTTMKNNNFHGSKKQGAFFAIFDCHAVLEQDGGASA